jgi:centrosomal protein CEP120
VLFCRSKSQAHEDEINRLKRSVAEWEKRFRDKEQEFYSYKEKQRHAPEVKLQADINMLTLEKVNISSSCLIKSFCCCLIQNELQRKFDAALASAERFKQQWTKALQELRRAKQREEDRAKSAAQRQQQELEHMRLRCV